MTQRTKWLVYIGCFLGLMTGIALTTPALAKKPKITGVININTASLEQLKLLPRIGPKVAARILAYRKKKLFKLPIDLTKVKGIGKKTFLKMKKHISTTTATNVKLKQGS